MWFVCGVVYVCMCVFVCLFACVCLCLFGYLCAYGVFCVESCCLFRILFDAFPTVILISDFC